MILRMQEKQEAKETVANQMAKVSAFLDEKVHSIAQVLRAEVEPEAFIQVAKMAVTRNPKLLTCVPMTLPRSVKGSWVT